MYVFTRGITNSSAVTLETCERGVAGLITAKTFRDLVHLTFVTVLFRLLIKKEEAVVHPWLVIRPRKNMYVSHVDVCSVRPNH